MIAKRWSNQDTYATAIEAHAADNGVPRALAYALIAQESGFNASAIRQEPAYVCQATGQTGDASYGLMQVLYCTALGLGYTDTPTGLFDVEMNLTLGMSLLGSLLASHGGDVAAALSAYNGGDRPSRGYGARQADGTFANQQYVTNILTNADYFDGYLADRDAAAAPDTSGSPIAPPPATDTGSGITPLGVVGAGLGLAGLWLFVRWLGR